MKKINTIIDTDTGIDDAIAVALAIKSPVLDIKMISASFGNVEQSQASKNVLRLIDLFGAANRGIIAARGAEKPITPATADVYHAHGKDGLGGMQYEFDKYTDKNLSKFASVGDIEQSYFDVLAKTDKVTVIEIAPMTNLAKFITKYPKLAREKIERIVFMGGSVAGNPFVGGGYQIPYAEFNINIDPDAAGVVLSSGIPLTMIPMEMGHAAFLTPAEIAKCEKLSAVGKIFHDIFPQYLDRHVMQPNIATHDMTAVAAVTNPELLQFVPAHIALVSNAHGQSAINVDFTKKPNATVAVDIKIDAARALFLECIKMYK